MKKKILFVMESLRIGGAEKSLVTILSLLDKGKYDIELYLFRQEGEFLEQVPEGVKLLPISDIDAMQKNFKTDWITYLKSGKIKRSFYSFKWLLGCCISKYVGHREEYIGWNNSTHLYSDIPGEYDVAIGFLEKKASYFIVDHVNAKKKIVFMHTDYDAIPHDKALDEYCYRQVDYLAVVSKHTKETMIKNFPFLEDKIKVIKNMVSPELINKMAEGEAVEMASSECDTKIVTVCRLTYPKNIDGAIDILQKLRKKGIDAEWFVVGEGGERKNLEDKIKKLGLENSFHLIGARSNPYPYMKACDIYVQPSRWEGYGITVAEAKVLYKPIVTSDIPEFREQIEDGVTGMIGKNEGKMAECIQQLIDNRENRICLCNNLKKESFEKAELEKLEQLIV